MIAGYAVSFIVMALYVASIYIRNRNLNQDKAMLEEMDDETVPAMQKPVIKPKPAQRKTGKTVTKKKSKK